MVVAAVSLLNSHIQDFDPVKVGKVVAIYLFHHSLTVHTMIYPQSHAGDLTLRKRMTLTGPLGRTVSSINKVSFVYLGYGNNSRRMVRKVNLTFPDRLVPRQLAHQS